jgi:hypothetical protein
MNMAAFLRRVPSRISKPDKSENPVCLLDWRQTGFFLSDIQMGLSDPAFIMAKP